MNKIKYTAKAETNKKIEGDIKKIEKYKDDSKNRCHQAIRKIKSKNSKKPLIVKDKKGKIVASEKGQMNLITEFFKEIFCSDEIAPIINPA